MTPIAFLKFLVLVATTLISPRAFSPITNQTVPNPLGGWSVVYFQVSIPSKRVSPAIPVRLKIPAISVDAAIERVGLTSRGAMDVPRNQNDTAWFELGQHPGEVGSAVIAGHYGRNKGRGSVFDALYKLRKGDMISIEDDTGTSTSFVVREIRRYDSTANASDVFTSNDGGVHLNLVTCEGAWNTALGGYTERLVVFTDKVLE